MLWLLNPACGRWQCAITGHTAMFCRIAAVVLLLIGCKFPLQSLLSRVFLGSIWWQLPQQWIVRGHASWVYNEQQSVWICVYCIRIIHLLRFAKAALCSGYVLELSASIAVCACVSLSRVKAAAKTYFRVKQSWSRILSRTLHLKLEFKLNGREWALGSESVIFTFCPWSYFQQM